MVIASELKGGMFIRIEGQIYEVLEAESRAGAAKLSGVVKSKLRNVIGGRMWEPHFRPDERLEDVELEQQTMEFLFNDADSCHRIACGDSGTCLMRSDWSVKRREIEIVVRRQCW